MSRNYYALGDISSSMSVELPFAPVDGIIRRNVGDARVSAAAAEALARHIQEYGASLAVEAARHADEAGRRTLQAGDFDVDDPPTRTELTLPIAPVDRIARLRIDDSYQVSEGARLALAKRLEDYGDKVAEGALLLAEHADRRTVKAEDIDAYVTLKP